MFIYYLNIFKILIKKFPSNQSELFAWGMMQPFYLWNSICRFDQKTFSEHFLRDFKENSILQHFTNRYLYFIFVLLYPIAMLFICFQFCSNCLGVSGAFVLYAELGIKMIIPSN